MALTQIPLQTLSVDAPSQQGDLFDEETWESAYREMHDVPLLLVHTRDELARAHKREAFWLSLLIHILVLALILFSPKFEKYFPQRTVMLAHSGRDGNNLTFLELPPDAQKPNPPRKTDVMADKSRTAMMKSLHLDRVQRKKIFNVMRQGRPGPVAPAPEKQPSTAPAQAAQAQRQRLQLQAQEQAQPTPPRSSPAKLQTPPVGQKPVFSSQSMSASRSVAEAARQVANNRGRYGRGDEGDLGLGQRQPTMRVGPYEITSDTMGVDFGPYMQRVLHDVRLNWYAIIPESAQPPLLKRGKVSIEFAILRNGQITALRYVDGSGDLALDRAAYGGITSSTPFPPLPSEFAGQYLGLRFTFLYNPDPKEADLR
jgi:TonB family protein